VNKIQEGSKYDLILMDIIMPNLDGVSACHLIRQFDRTPIIAMTSNIRSDDIQLYFQHGMPSYLITSWRGAHKSRYGRRSPETVHSQEFTRHA
jgi:CheY-like chemotaxis protein